MKKIILGLFYIVLISMYSCKKDNFGGVSNSSPDIPVTVSNVYGTYTYPTVSTSLSGGGAISITLNIPSNSGRTIKEITRVAAGTSGTNYKSIEIATGLYNTSVITGSGTSVTFTTTLAEYYSKTAITPITAAGAGLSTSFLGRYFFFLITLDNGQTIVPTAVRVYVAS